MENNNVKEQVRDAGNATKQAATSEHMITLARFGYAAKGLVYFIMGILIAQLTVGQESQSADQQGALLTIFQQPFGRILLIIVTVGLFGFALWNIIQALLDTEHKGTDTKGIVTRLGYAGIGIFYGFFAYGALQLAMGTGDGGSSSTETAQSWTATLLQTPFGVPLLVVVGLGIIAGACFLFYYSYRARFVQHLNLTTLEAPLRKWAINSGRLGYATLGLDFLIIGFFLIIAAIQHNPEQAKGLETFLEDLLHQPAGPVLVAIVAIGIVAYGVFCLVEARYRQM